MRKTVIAAIAAGLAGSAAAMSALGFEDPTGGRATSVIRGNQAVTEGSGRQVRQARTLPAFERIVLDDAVNASIALGPRFSVTVSADDNLVGRVLTKVENGTLRIGVAGSYRTRSAPAASIVMPALERVDLHASSDARISGMRGGRLALSSNGSGGFHIDGEVGDLEVELLGSGDAELGALRAEHVRIELNGSGNARVHATRSLQAEVNGSGHIRYAGGAASIERAVHGTGTIGPAGWSRTP